VPSESARRRIEGLGRKVGFDGRLQVIRQGEAAGPALEAIARAGEERERRRTAAEEHHRDEQEERTRREAEFRARQEELGRQEAAAREAQEREEARLPNRLRRAVRGY